MPRSYIFGNSEWFHWRTISECSNGELAKHCSVITMRCNRSAANSPLFWVARAISPRTLLPSARLWISVKIPGRQRPLFCCLLSTIGWNIDWTKWWRRSALSWQIFNVLAGNLDGYAKDLLLLYRPDGEVRLAPFYCLLFTRAIARIDDKSAFAVGGERNPDYQEAYVIWNQIRLGFW